MEAFAKAIEHKSDKKETAKKNEEDKTEVAKDETEEKKN